MDTGIDLAEIHLKGAVMMAQIIESIPEARLLLMSLRSVGYTEETAIADIIDNSISAEAASIHIDFDWDKQKIIISDNGKGMDKESLIRNMRIGSADPTEIRKAKDLGRFGMGMKTAAFSLGKRLTVVTKSDGVYSNATWDLEAVAEYGWKLLIQDDDALVDYYPLIKEEGTIVIIEKLDRLIDSVNLTKSKSRFYRMIDRTEKHISLTFHRFIEEGISFFLQGNPVTAWNPFVLDNRATEEKPEEYCYSDDGNHLVVIQPYILPHKTKFASEEDYNKAGGFKGWNYHQGFYVYRNKRLIVYGTWFDYVKKEPAYNLARIKLDITSDSDELWGIDIKKSTASLPLFVRDTIERIIDDTVDNSARVYNSRGTYTRNITVPNLSYVWEQRKVNGKYTFYINRKHTLLTKVKEQLDDRGKETLAAYLALIENFAPFMMSGVTTSLQKMEESQKIDMSSIEYRTEVGELKRYMALFKEQGFTNEEIRTTFLEMSNYRHLKQIVLKMTEEEV